ncbi:UNVERIFIED_CONTAM: hypothetical protein GTU68_032720 [Idotea baltica]|nr:hypothetical protein [Idotea baltica]
MATPIRLFAFRVLLSISWDSDDARWSVVAERTDTGERVELTCGFVMSCSGYYRYDHGYTPEFDGLDGYEGTVIHPQAWPEDFDATGKNIVVIGSGATAITLIPALASDAESVTMLQRSPTYIAAMLPKSPAARLFHKLLPKKQAGTATRWFHALATQLSYEYCKRFPNAAKKMLRKGVEMQLPKGFDVDTHFTPKYDPWDQRLCVAPNGDFFRTIKHGDAQVVTDTIDTFTSDGIRLTSGDVLAADTVVTATGLELLYLGGMSVTVDGELLDLSKKMTFNGMMLQDVPNMAVVVGYTNASWTLKADLTSAYVGRLLATMRRTGATTCTPRNSDGEVSDESLLGLSAGYVQRSAHLLPRQGTRSPWKVRQSYLSDYRSLGRGDGIDPALEMSTAPAAALFGVPQSRVQMEIAS